MINFSVLKNYSRVKKYLRNTIIAKADMGTEMVVVLKGEVGVFLHYHKQSQEMITTIGPGDFFGETALLLEKSAPFTTVALTDVIVLPINRVTLATFIREEPDLTLELMKALCARMDTVSTAYEKVNGAPWVEAKPLPEEPLPVQTEVTQQAPPVPTAPSPVAAAQDDSQSICTALFPEGHGSYQLPLNKDDRVYLMEKGYTCPVCKKEFKALQVRTSRLVMDSTDSDMRHRYKGIEPLYYDVVTCPECLYSALAEMFNSLENRKADLKDLQAVKTEITLLYGTQLDTSSVFASYYLALLCAPKCFTAHNLATAKLLLKLSRLYQDCGDALMEEKTTKRALDAYMNVYINGDTDPAQDQQLCIIIGELHFKLNDFKNAKDFFFKVKTNRDGIPLLKTQAENRILDIRTIEGK